MESISPSAGDVVALAMNPVLMVLLFRLLGGGRAVWYAIGIRQARAAQGAGFARLAAAAGGVGLLFFFQFTLEHFELFFDADLVV
ncbi:hypothetical protein KAM373_08930 [Aeromonas caviae]|nr:hypothetical protein KAM373_08930 [Aeromonas caviae]